MLAIKEVSICLLNFYFTNAVLVSSIQVFGKSILFFTILQLSFYTLQSITLSTAKPPWSFIPSPITVEPRYKEVGYNETLL